MRFDDILKAIVWTRGPRGGTRRRLPGGKWEYKTRDTPASVQKRGVYKRDLRPGLPASPEGGTRGREAGAMRSLTGVVAAAAKKTESKGTAGTIGGGIRLSRGQLMAVIRGGHYSVVSPLRNPSDPGETNLKADDPLLKMRYTDMKADLDAHGFVYTEVEKEHSDRGIVYSVVHSNRPLTTVCFLVQHEASSERKVIRDIGAKHNQEYVIHCKGKVHELHYVTGDHAGTYAPSSGYKVTTAADVTKIRYEFKWGSYRKFASAILKAAWRREGRYASIRKD